MDSDYPPMALRNLRRQYGDGNIREEGLYGENRLCACGQIYHKETQKCPLCGKINQESRKINMREPEVIEEYRRKISEEEEKIQQEKNEVSAIEERCENLRKSDCSNT